MRKKKMTRRESETLKPGGGRCVPRSYRRIFGKRTLSTSSRILKAEEGWGEIYISTKGVVDRRKEGGGRGRAFPFPPPPCPLLPKSNDDGSANYRQFN